MPLKTDELRTQPLGPMPTPAELVQAHPLTDDVAERIEQSRRQIEAILAGEDDRLLAIVVLLLGSRHRCCAGLCEAFE